MNYQTGYVDIYAKIINFLFDGPIILHQSRVNDESLYQCYTTYPLNYLNNNDSFYYTSRLGRRIRLVSEPENFNYQNCSCPPGYYVNFFFTLFFFGFFIF